MTMTPESKEYFEKVAPDWDNLREGYFTEEVRNAAISRAYLRPDTIAADIGAGTGFITAGLAAIIRKVHAVDGSAAMLEKARQNLDAFTNIEYHTADGQSIPLPDESMDAVFANMYLHHCPDPLAAIQEMARILRPGGRMIITDEDRHTHLWLMEEMADVWPGFEHEEIRRWFKAAGFVNIILDSTGESCCAQSQNTITSTDGTRQAQVSIFAAVGTKPVKEMQSQVENNYGELARTGSCCGNYFESASCCQTAQAPIQEAETEPDCNCGQNASGASCCEKAARNYFFDWKVFRMIFPVCQLKRLNSRLDAGTRLHSQT